jgi:hypothetical protein
VTCFARGQKIAGAGKAFEFAQYSDLPTNFMRYVPSNINIVEVASSEYPVKLNVELGLMENTDFSPKQQLLFYIHFESYAMRRHMNVTTI